MSIVLFLKRVDQTRIKCVKKIGRVKIIQVPYFYISRFSSFNFFYVLFSLRFKSWHENECVILQNIKLSLQNLDYTNYMQCTLFLSKENYKLYSSSFFCQFIDFIKFMGLVKHNYKRSWSIYF